MVHTYFYWQDPQIKEQCPDIKWHFIGHLQSNKSKLLSSVHNLSMIETIDSVKLCDKLRNDFTLQNRLKVLVQINSSGEEQKSGVEPDKVVPLVDYIIKECPTLDFKGLMTIGSYRDDPDNRRSKKCQVTYWKSPKTYRVSVENISKPFVCSNSIWWVRYWR